jgi:hypothetical protein
MELVLLFQWFNPAIWLLKREMKDIHEYQADISVLKSGIDATKYQLLLVKKAVGASSYTLANSFNHSKIKKRITMMLKIKSNKWARLKLLLLLPLGTLFIYAFAHIEVNESPDSIIYDKGINNLGDKQNGDDYHFIRGQKEGFCFPLPSMIEVTGKYEKRKNELHAGYDLTGRSGDEIVAAFDGDVVASEYDKAYGNFIRIQHAGGLSTLYAHNSKNLVELNTSVKAGTVIAIIGNTGRSTGVHLHFEIHKNGKPIDPATIIDFDKKALKENGISPKIPQKSIQQQLDSISRTRSKERIGNPPIGKFEVMAMSGYYESSDIITTIHPIAYSKKADEKESDYLRIYWYVIDGKKYSWNKFMDKCRNGKVFFERSKIEPGDGKIVEVYGITTDGAKTPTFYMVGSE